MTHPPATVTVEVTFTDRTRTVDGRYREFVRRPTVLVELGESPELVAAQLIACLVSPFDGMVLGAVAVDAVV
jgi:hypothetical protein